MTFDFQYPKITGKSESEKSEQLRRYLCQLVDQLKWALNTTKGENSDGAVEGKTSGKESLQEIKAQLLGAPDILSSFYHKLEKLFADAYVSKEELPDEFLIKETGIIGNFRWQRYGSGFTVAYGSFTEACLCETGAGSLYEGSVSFSIPDGIFTSVETVTSSLFSSDVRGMTLQSINADAIQAKIFSPVRDTEAHEIKADFAITGFYITQGG